MAERFSAGIDVTKNGAIALIVSTRSGKIAAIETGETERDAFESAMQNASLSQAQLLGIGFSQPKPRAEPWAFASTPVVTALSRAHACLPGAGVASPSTMVLAFEANTCTLVMNSRIESRPTTATMIPNSVLPGYFGYQFAPIDVDVSTTKTMEDLAFAVRVACESLRGVDVPVRRFVATGSISRSSPELMQILADVLDGKIKLAASEHAAALGAAVLAALAAGPERAGHASQSQLIHAMAHVRRDLIYRPDVRTRKRYDT